MLYEPLSDQRKFRTFSRPPTLVLELQQPMSVDSVSCVACKVALYFRRARADDLPQGFANVLNKAGESVTVRLRDSRSMSSRNNDLNRREWVRVKDVSAFRPMMAVTARIYLPKSEQRAATVNDRGYLLTLAGQKTWSKVS